MQIRRDRKYPIQYKKAAVEPVDRSIDISLAAAAGIIAAVFVGGFISGWMVKRKW